MGPQGWWVSPERGRSTEWSPEMVLPPLHLCSRGSSLAWECLLGEEGFSGWGALGPREEVTALILPLVRVRLSVHQWLCARV